ncbi:immunoglobulin domain-containing protein [Chryseolinea sp. T2]|uniref:immunoglobulin domain-containing protein n=1 Tax=Chryseolinea sp. T2 TaxID=3129255 RepID=UPI0030772031
MRNLVVRCLMLLALLGCIDSFGQYNVYPVCHPIDDMMMPYLRHGDYIYGHDMDQGKDYLVKSGINGGGWRREVPAYWYQGDVWIDNADNAYVRSSRYNEVTDTYDNRLDKFLSNGTPVWNDAKAITFSSSYCYVSKTGYIFTFETARLSADNAQAMLVVYDPNGNEVRRPIISDFVDARNNYITTPTIRESDAGEIYVSYKEYTSSLQAQWVVKKYTGFGVAALNTSGDPWVFIDTDTQNRTGEFYISSNGNLLLLYKGYDPILFRDIYSVGAVDANSASVAPEKQIQMDIPSFGSPFTFVRGNLYISQVEFQQPFRLYKIDDNLDPVLVLSANGTFAEVILSDVYNGAYYINYRISFLQRNWLYAKYQIDGTFNWRYPSQGIFMGYNSQNGNVILVGDGCASELVSCANRIATIINSPASVETCSGQDITFTFQADATQPLYYWYRKTPSGNIQLPNSVKYAGTSTTTLTINDISFDDQGTYFAEVVDECNGTRAKTADINISVGVAPQITDQPDNAAVCSGIDASFTVASSGGRNVRYRWMKGNVALTDNAQTTGTSTPTLTIRSVTANQAGTYRCEITYDCGASPLMSQPAELSLLSPTTIVDSPDNYNGCAGSNLSLTVVAAGSGLTYKWKKNNVYITNNTRITGASSPTLSITALEANDAGEYRCEVSGGCGVNVISDASTVTIPGDVQITSHPKDIAVCAGSQAMFSVTSSGASSTYRWKKGDVLISNGGKYSGALTSTLVVSNATAAEAGAYVCVVTGPCGKELISEASTLAIGATASILSVDGGGLKCAGDLLVMTASVSGDVRAYQWLKNGTPLSDNNRISGSKTYELYIAQLSKDDAGKYSCRITSGCNTEKTSPESVVELRSAPAITKQAASTTICSDEDVELSIDVTGDVNEIIWLHNGTAISDGNGVAGSKTKELHLTAADVQRSGYYTCQVRGCSGTTISESTLITVNPKPDLRLKNNNSCDIGSDLEFRWSDIVEDLNNTYGDWYLTKEGSNEHLDLTELKSLGNYIIHKKTAFCESSISWKNECMITAVSNEVIISVSIAPNPAIGEIHMQYEPSALTGFDIINAQGQLVHKGLAESSGESFINARTWSSGAYTVVARDKKGKFSSVRFLLTQ